MDEIPHCNQLWSTFIWTSGEFCATEAFRSAVLQQAQQRVGPINIYMFLYLFYLFRGSALSFFVVVVLSITLDISDVSS